MKTLFTNIVRKALSHARNATAAVGSLAIASPAFADGFTKADSLLEKVSSGLMGLAVVVITIAALVVGYRTLYDGRALSESKNIIIGGIIIASVSEIASILTS
ncbi:TrbC/VirB2 family protein [Pantoea agglomerans]|uniref:TrbC/VirB2 family protein n=1 Tax=Enterobacter agglomerans TaxID=549 RepID=UPI000DAC0C14|nr:TrbC/VirB2 family protein [Pantoea agglomerans]RAH26332.1 TriB protein [Pantoea agglomerans]TGX88186.1 TriB protein [Pantoea agglomerans]